MKSVCTNSKCDEKEKPKYGDTYLEGVVVLCGNCLTPCEVDPSATKSEPDNADPAN